MGFSKITEDLNIIASLSDEPNIDDGLSASQLKAKFDESGNKIKNAVNNLIDELEESTASAEIGASELYVGDESEGTVQAKLEHLLSKYETLFNGGFSDNSIVTSKLVDDIITTSKINNNAVTTDKIVDNAIITSKINNGAVTSAKLDTDAKKAENLSATPLSATDISDATIQAKLEHLQDELIEITQEGVADNSISTAKIMNNAITLAKIDPAVSATFVPSGLICMWSGSTIPSGWLLCDGTNGTPDLKDRFIVGAGGSYTIGDTGGSDTVTLTTEQIPSHHHSLTLHTSSSSSFGSGIYTGSASSSTISTSTNATGGDQAHENRPPYYALAYIMKV